MLSIDLFYLNVVLKLLQKLKKKKRGEGPARAVEPMIMIIIRDLLSLSGLYRLTCTDCFKTYVGHTDRNF